MWTMLLFTSWCFVFMNFVIVCYAETVKVDTNLDEVQREILRAHNKLRANVSPPAANMLKMSWDNRAAKEAKILANKCDFEHNKYQHIIFGQNGQNLHLSTRKLSWSQVTQDWYDEVKFYTYGSKYNDLHTIGHFTQVVWGTTHLVGCAVTHCQNTVLGQAYLYVCNYHPAGNNQLMYPYIEGPFCRECSNDCTEGRLCTNACEAGVDMYSNCHEFDCPVEGCTAYCDCKDKIVYRPPYIPDDSEIYENVTTYHENNITTTLPPNCIEVDDSSNELNATIEVHDPVIILIKNRNKISVHEVNKTSGTLDNKIESNAASWFSNIFDNLLTNSKPDANSNFTILAISNSTVIIN